MMRQRTIARVIACIGLVGLLAQGSTGEAADADCSRDIIKAAGSTIYTVSGAQYIPLRGDYASVLWRPGDKVLICPKSVTYGNAVLRFIEITDVDQQSKARLTRVGSGQP